MTVTACLLGALSIDTCRVRTATMSCSLATVVGVRQLFAFGCGGLLLLYGVLGVSDVTVPTVVVVAVAAVGLVLVGVAIGELHATAKSQ